MTDIQSEKLGRLFKWKDEAGYSHYTSHRPINHSFKEWISIDAHNAALDRAVAAAREKEDYGDICQKTEATIRHWQDAIREEVIKLSGATDGKIDGAGCESGDPLDFTLAEIRQGFAFALDAAQADTKRLEEQLTLSHTGVDAAMNQKPK